MTGASLTGVTVKLNVLVLFATPSVTVMATVDPPLEFAVGVIVTVQFGAVPANTMLATGNSTVFDDVALTEVVQLKILSTSVIVNGIAAVVVSSLVV